MKSSIIRDNNFCPYVLLSPEDQKVFYKHYISLKVIIISKDSYTELFGFQELEINSFPWGSSRDLNSLCIELQEEIFEVHLTLLSNFPLLPPFQKFYALVVHIRCKRRFVLMGHCSQTVKMRQACEFSSSSAPQRLLGCFYSWAKVYEYVWLLTPAIDKTQLFLWILCCTLKKVIWCFRLLLKNLGFANETSDKVLSL